MDGNKHGNTRDKQKEGECAKAGKRRLFESRVAREDASRREAGVEAAIKNKKMSRRRGMRTANNDLSVCGTEV
jgi:hypothetical protein